MPVRVHVRAPCRSRRRRLHPAVRAGDRSREVTTLDENTIIERRACISGVGQSDIGRRLFRDPLELTLDGCLAAIAARGPDDRRHRRHLDLSRSDGDARGLLRRRRVRRHGRAAAEVRLVRQRPRDVGPARLGRERVPGGRVRAREPRALLPLGLRRFRAGRQGPRRGHARRRGRRRELQGVGVHGVEPAVLARRRPRSGSRCSPSATSTSTARRASSSRGSRSTRGATRS